MFRTMFICLSFLFVFSLSCQSSSKDSQTSSATTCEECLSTGGTWQIDECTTNCALQDISCYEDECPPPCSESCSGCFTESECLSAGCEWVWEEYGSTCETAN